MYTSLVRGGDVVVFCLHDARLLPLFGSWPVRRRALYPHSARVRGQSSEVLGVTRGSPGAALAAVAAERLGVAVAFHHHHADVGLHQFSDVHHLEGEQSMVRGD